MTDRPPPGAANVLRLILLGSSVLAVEWIVLVFLAVGQVDDEYERLDVLDGGGYRGDIQAVSRGTVWWLLLLLAQALLAVFVALAVRRRRRARARSRN